MDDILRRAEDLGRALREHPRYKRLVEADGRVRADKQATAALDAYNQAILKIAEKEHRQQPIPVEDKRDAERLRQAVVANETVKAFMRTQADYAELMKRMNDAIYGELRPPTEEPAPKA